MNADINQLNNAIDDIISSSSSWKTIKIGGGQSAGKSWMYGRSPLLDLLDNKIVVEFIKINSPNPFLSKPSNDFGDAMRYYMATDFARSQSMPGSYQTGPLFSQRADIKRGRILKALKDFLAEDNTAIGYEIKWLDNAGVKKYAKEYDVTAEEIRDLFLTLQPLFKKTL